MDEKIFAYKTWCTNNTLNYDTRRRNNQQSKKIGDKDGFKSIL